VSTESTAGFTADATNVTASRRAFVRYAAGLLGAAGLAAVGRADGAARTGKRSHRDGNTAAATRTADRRPGSGKRGTCRPGKAVARIDLPADGRRIETPVLAKGRTYRLRASGFVGLANADGRPALGSPAVDADYGFFRQGAPRPNDRVGNLDWGIALDGKVPSWGAFDEAHAYEILVAGRGKPLTVELVYAADEFAPDGQGSLGLEIACA
jgi:hypothetical protein